MTKTLVRSFALFLLGTSLAFPVTMVESPALGTQTTLKLTYPVGVGNISLLINTAQGVFRDSCYLTVTNNWQGFRIGIYDTTNNSLEGWQYGSPGWQQTLSSNQCSVDLAASTRTNDGYSDHVEIRLTKGSRLALGNASVVADYWYQYCTTYCNNENAVVTVGF